MSAFWMALDFLWAKALEQVGQALYCSALQLAEQTLFCYFIYPLLNPVKEANLYCCPHLIGEEPGREVSCLAPGHIATPGPQPKLSPLTGVPALGSVIFSVCSM